MDRTAETQPDIPPPSPTRAAFPVLTIPALTAIVLRLIAHGRELAATLHRRAALPGFARTARLVGSSDPAVIAICIQRGLRRAAALCAMLARREARGLGVPLPALPLGRDAPDQEPAAPAATPRACWWHTTDLTYLPTEAEAAQEVRIRGFGCVVMAISLDLGVDVTSPGSPWHDMLMPISLCGGSGPALDQETRRRLGELPGRPQDRAPWPRQRRAADGSAASAREQYPQQESQAPRVPQYASAACPPPEPCPAAEPAFGATPAETAPPMPWPVMPSPALEVAATGPD